MKTKHTPGPWVAVKSSNNGWEICGVLGDLPERRNMVEFTYASNKPVLLFVEPWHQFPNEKWNEMQQANARLIAAAPDLLAALEMIVNDGLSTSRIAAGRAAIAKALGKDGEA